MKKLLTLSAVVACAVSANAQKPNIETSEDKLVQTLHSNLVIYECAPGATEAVETPIGLKKDITATAYEELGITFQSYEDNNTNQVVITQDYTDPETGAKFPKGYYYPAKVGGSRSYFASNLGGATGIKNVKKMIFYWAAGSSGGVQFSSYLVREGGTTVPNESTGTSVSEPARYTMDANDKIKFSVPYLDTKYTVKDEEGNDKEMLLYGTNGNYYYTMMDEEKNTPTTTWTTFACVQPLKLTLDFTQPAEVLDGSIDVQGDLSGDIVIPYGHYLWEKRDDAGKDVAGDPITWSADNILQQGYKKAAYLLGIAFICGDEGASTFYANVSESTDDDEATWHTSAEAAHSDLVATDEPENNFYFSWMLTDDYKTFVKTKLAEAAGIHDIATTAKSSQSYNLAGQRSNAAQGIKIKDNKVIFCK